MNAHPKTHLGHLLKDQKLINDAQLAEALKQQRQIGGSLGEHVVRLGMVTEPLLLDTLSKQTGYRHADLSGKEIAPAVLRLVRHDTVTSRRVLPVAMEGNHLVLGMLDPTDLAAISEAEFQSGKTVIPAVLSGRQFHRALDTFDSGGYGERPLRLEPESALKPHRDSLDSMLATLVSWKGQDLHLTDGAVPAVRVDGEMRRLDLPVLTGKEIRDLVAVVLTVDQQKSFHQQLELDFAYQSETAGRFRCNLYRQKGTLAFTARHIAERIPSMEELRLPPFLADFALKRQGLFLVTGPNGHGKSTTLACLIDLINTQRHANIVSIEDPVEFVHRHQNSNVNQREVGHDTHSFADGLRHVFRQNPDVIVIGEMRDPESISIALTAAETGHLVMASMHAMNSTAAIDRIVDVFPADQQRQVRMQLAESLLLVFSQRLVAAASGSGRVLAWEKMSNSIRVANAIRDGSAHALRSLMQSNLAELTSMDSCLADLVATGKVKLTEAQKWAENPGYVQELAALRTGQKKA